MGIVQKNVLLSFDTEEFDMPLEYGYSIPLQEQLDIGKNGLDKIIHVLNTHLVPATFYVTAQFALHFPHIIKQLSQRHEIASHTYFHSTFSEEHLLSSRIELENITETPVYGLRMPRMMPVTMKAVQQAGYLYDSSINPTLLPGRYNNLHLPRTVYKDETMLRIPASVSPLLRIPLFWLSFKNIPYTYYVHLVKRTLAHDGYVNLYFHPWEFTKIEHGLPAYTRRGAGTYLLDRLSRLISDLKKEGVTFSTTYSYLKNQL